MAEPGEGQENAQYDTSSTYSTYSTDSTYSQSPSTSTTTTTSSSTQQHNTQQNNAGPIPQQHNTDANNNQTTTHGFNQKIRTAKGARARNIIKGVGKTVGRYSGKVGKTTGRLGIGAAGALLTSIPAIAAGLTTGEPEKILQYGATGAAAGYVGAQGAANKVADSVRNAHREKLKRRSESEEYQTRKTIKKLIEDGDFNRLCEELGITGKRRNELIRQFTGNGIKDSEDIKKSVSIMREKPGTSKEDVIAAHKIKKEAQRRGMDKDKIREKLRKQEVPIHEVERAIDLIDML